MKRSFAQRVSTPILVTLLFAFSGTSMGACKSAEEKEFEADLRAVDEEVDKMINDKISEFSFEVYPDWKTRDIKETKDIDTVTVKLLAKCRALGFHPLRMTTSRAANISKKNSKLGVHGERTLHMFCAIAKGLYRGT